MMLPLLLVAFVSVAAGFVGRSPFLKTAITLRASSDIEQGNPAPPLTQTQSQQQIPRVGGDMPAGRRPDWFHVPAPSYRDGQKFEELRQSIKDLDLHTVCEEAQCPNIGECWNGGTYSVILLFSYRSIAACLHSLTPDGTSLTIIFPSINHHQSTQQYTRITYHLTGTGTLMLLGDTCTRGCKFCAVNTNTTPSPPDPFEPFKTAEALAKWDITYVVLTSVDRDDMDDGGASHFATTVQLIKQRLPHMLVECLVSDFAGNRAAVETLAMSGLDVYAHNIETVRRLQPYVRDFRASYKQSLEVLQHAKTTNPNLYTKSSLMLGLGETKDEVRILFYVLPSFLVCHVSVCLSLSLSLSLSYPSITTCLHALTPHGTSLIVISSPLNQSINQSINLHYTPITRYLTGAAMHARLARSGC